jgi:hypothetical protein
MMNCFAEMRQERKGRLREGAPKSGSKESLILGEDEICVDVEEQEPQQQEEHYVTVVHSTAEQGAIPKTKKDDKKKKKKSLLQKLKKVTYLCKRRNNCAQMSP